jgi:hypothetical protein
MLTRHDPPSREDWTVPSVGQATPKSLPTHRPADTRMLLSTHRLNGCLASLLIQKPEDKTVLAPSPPYCSPHWFISQWSKLPVSWLHRSEANLAGRVSSPAVADYDSVLSSVLWLPLEPTKPPILIKTKRYIRLSYWIYVKMRGSLRPSLSCTTRSSSS